MGMHSWAAPGCCSVNLRKRRQEGFKVLPGHLASSCGQGPGVPSDRNEHLVLDNSLEQEGVWIVEEAFLRPSSQTPIPHRSHGPTCCVSARSAGVHAWSGRARPFSSGGMWRRTRGWGGTKTRPQLPAGGFPSGNECGLCLNEGC